MASTAVINPNNEKNFAASDTAKETKRAKKEKKRGDKNQEGNNRGLRLKIILFVSAFFVLIIALAVLAVVINFRITSDRGARDILRDFIVSVAVAIDPTTTSLEETLEAKRLEIDALEEELAERESKLAAEEETLNKNKLELSVRERSVAERESVAFPIYRQPLSEQDVEDMTSIAMIYAAMDPADAAGIMARLYTTQSMASIIYFMVEKKAALILAEMDARIAAEITELLLSE